jgi:protoheme IX farnesyltransferase
MSRSGRSPVGPLAVALVGVYGLLLAGATTSITGAARACSTWPACNGEWLALGSPALAVAWTHRLAAVVVGVLVVVAAVLAWRRGARRRVLGALAAALALYPAQVAIGAFAATAGDDALVSWLHLAVGMVILSALVVALAWTLESETPGDPAESDDAGGEPTPAAEPAGGTAEPEPPSGPLATARAYLELTKPRLMWLLCLVAAAGMALAAGPELTVRTVALTLGGGVLAIGASGTFNHVLERDRDTRMERTADRPLATAEVPTRNAFAFGVVLATAAVAVFLQVNALAAALGLAAILYYSVVYTLILKPNTVQNTVVGGFAGALPALIGWAAVTESVGLTGLALAGVIFLWTPAHFYNLALAYREDYERGGFPMLPVVRGAAVTRKHILLYLGATMLATAALAALAGLGALYAGVVVVFGAVFVWAVIRLHRERDRRAALRSFHASNAYLGALLLAVVLDALLV